nr:immunoglobulin heavy chain junction region [Macaca mulatta]
CARLYAWNPNALDDW